MRIGLGYTTVRGPAGVADADVAAQAGRLGCVFHLLYTAHTAHALNHALLRAHRNTGRIIASQSSYFKPGKQANRSSKLKGYLKTIRQFFVPLTKFQVAFIIYGQLLPNRP